MIDKGPFPGPRGARAAARGAQAAHVLVVGRSHAGQRHCILPRQMGQPHDKQWCCHGLLPVFCTPNRADIDGRGHLWLRRQTTWHTITRTVAWLCSLLFGTDRSVCERAGRVCRAKWSGGNHPSQPIQRARWRIITTRSKITPSSASTHSVRQQSSAARRCRPACSVPSVDIRHSGKVPAARRRFLSKKESRFVRNAINGAPEARRPQVLVVRRSHAAAPKPRPSDQRAARQTARPASASTLIANRSHHLRSQVRVPAVNAAAVGNNRGPTTRHAPQVNSSCGWVGA